MTSATLDQSLFLIFFIYGMAFFGMGLAMALESGRSPALAEARLLRPLALFGILHGIHEWLEFFIVQAAWIGFEIPNTINWLRLAILAVSFIALLWYGFQAFLGQTHERRSWTRLSFIALVLYVLAISGSALTTYAGATDIPWIRLLDALIRYLLAIPGALLAALGLRFQASQMGEQRKQIALYLNQAALVFGLYGITQVFVPALAMMPANIINAETFRSVSGFPHQIIRAILAVLITFYLIRATQVVERERQVKVHSTQEQLFSAQQARLEALQQQESLRRNLLRHTVRAQEEERGRIARELHDETAQTLSALSLELATMRAMLKRQPGVLRKVERLQEYSRSISQSLYRLVHDLRPAQLDDLGLVPALESLIEQDCPPKGLEVSIHVSGCARRMDPLIETVLFRVVQEALNNIARHARTPYADVRLDFGEEKVSLKVADQGLGFDVSESFTAPRGWGLAGMRERVESLSGEFHLNSSPGCGTNVMVVIPLTAK